MIIFVFVLVLVYDNKTDSEDVTGNDDDNDDDAAEARDDDFEEYWQKTEVEREHNWYNVSGLLHGRTYRLRVAAVDRHGDMMKSDYVEVVVGIHPGNQSI